MTREQVPLGDTPTPDHPPEDLLVGAINPRALVEAMLNRRMNWNDENSVDIMADTLQKQYDELFDPRYGSPLYAGLKLTSHGFIERVDPRDVKIITEKDMQTPDLSGLSRLQDVGKVANVSDINKIPIEQSCLVNGKLRLQLFVKELDRTMNNMSLTEPVADVVISKSKTGQSDQWKPRSGQWRDIHEFRRVNEIEYDYPRQGAVGDSWLIAALSAVAWAMPQEIVHRMRTSGESNPNHVTKIKLHSKGGHRDAPTATIEVKDPVVRMSNDRELYAHSFDSRDLTPGLYEKAFAKWLTGNKTDEPDMTSLTGGDPVKAMAQITNLEPCYYKVGTRQSMQVFGIVRAHCAQFKTIYPMTAITYPSGELYTGSDLVANHAYTILGWAERGRNTYIILRNPWGYHEPHGRTVLLGLIKLYETSFWHPVNLLKPDGVFAVEIHSFKKYFDYIGVAK